MEKTLKDIMDELIPCNVDCDILGLHDNLRKEAIKWAKEDRNSIKVDKKMPMSTRMIANYIVTKWMRRLNITEEELK